MKKKLFALSLIACGALAEITVDITASHTLGLATAGFSITGSATQRELIIAKE